MSDPRYELLFSDHPAHESLEQAREALASVPDDFLAEKQEDPEGWLVRLERIFDHIGTLLAAADPALVNPASMDGFKAQLDQVAAALNALTESRDWAQIPTIKTTGEGLLNTAMQFAPAVGVWTGSEVEEAASKLGEAATAKTKSLQGQFGNLQARLNQLNEEADQSFASLKEKSEERADQMQVQVDGIKTELDAEQAQAKETIANFETQFTTKQAERDEQFEATRKEMADLSTATVSELKEANEEAEVKEKERADQTIEDLKSDGEGIIDFLNDKKDEAAKLIELVAGSSTAGAFGIEADAQKKEADKWRDWAIRIAAVAGVIGAIVVVVSFFRSASTAEQIGKAFTVAVLLSIAAYAANQSTQHRRREQRAKRLQLELAAFGPFTGPLEPAEQNEVRKELIERIFVGDPGVEEANSGKKTEFSDEQFNLVMQAWRFFQENHK